MQGRLRSLNAARAHNVQAFAPSRFLMRPSSFAGSPRPLLKHLQDKAVQSLFLGHGGTRPWRRRHRGLKISHRKAWTVLRELLPNFVLTVMRLDGEFAPPLSQPGTRNALSPTWLRAFRVNQLGVARTLAQHGSAPLSGSGGPGFESPF